MALNANEPKLSVVIPTYNPKPYLPALLEALASQTIDFELVIVDSSSTDGSRAELEAHADVFLTVTPETFDHGATRTLAAKSASGEYLLFLTQDALPQNEETFANLVRFIRSIPDAGATFGRQLPYRDATLVAAHLRAFNYPETSYVRRLSDASHYGIKTAFLSDSFALYRKEALQHIGWFKPDLIVGEDTYAGGRMLIKGYAIGYCADACVFHSHDYSLIQEFRRYFDIGVFHTRESWLLETFGKSEGEGRRYVLSLWRYLIEKGAYGTLLASPCRIGMKWLGYKLGRRYRSIPSSWLRYLSMHPQWWQHRR